MKFDSYIPGNTKTAFSLAGTLITLMIIGVIAVITIPNLITKYQKKVWTTKLQQSYNMISNVHTELLQELGSVNDWPFSGWDEFNNGSHKSNANLNALYAKKLKAKNCTPNGPDTYTNCPNFKRYTIFKLNGEKLANAGWDFNSPFYTSYIILLQNGALLSTTFRSNAGGGYRWDLYSLKIPVMYRIDVNGEQKPNTMGRDIFTFALYDGENTLNPFRGFKDSPNDCNKDDIGWTCAERLLRNGWKMDY